jgi:hypothetical protein
MSFLAAELFAQRVRLSSQARFVWFFKIINAAAAIFRHELPLISDALAATLPHAQGVGRVSRPNFFTSSIKRGMSCGWPCWKFRLHRFVTANSHANWFFSATVFPIHTNR